MPQEDVAGSRTSTKAAVALLLTFSAGYVDVVGYLALYQVFTANMTGNTVHFAINLLHSRWQDAMLAGSMIPIFVTGSIVGRAIIEVGARNRIRRTASLTLLIEALLIGFASLAPPHARVPDIEIGCLAALAFAMGIQTAALTRIGPLTIHTTFVTGMLNKLAQLISHSVFLAYDRLHGEKRVIDAQKKVRRQAFFIFSIWLTYFVGAIAGTKTEGVLGLRALLIPIVLLAIAILADQVSPLSIREEKEQLESGA
jgi:uncharacterized membrane protein YoaK (UPF0700 family)